MRAALVGLGLLAATASARAQAGDAGTKPGWVQALETANPYVSVAGDVYGGASAALGASEALKASQVSRAIGNRAARKAAAEAYNAARASGQGVVKAIERFNVGTLTTAADVGGTLAGHLVEGDLRAVPGVVATAAAKNVTTAGGAWAGGALAGAAAGLWLGPVGTLAGGVVGGAAGALAASMGYDTVSDALARNGYYNVQSYVDSLAAEAPVDYVEKARQARREHLEAQEDERRRAEKRRREELPGYVEQAREARREHLEESEQPDAAVPVIPVDCTIDVTAGSAPAEWHATFRVDGDKVTLHSESTLPGHQAENFRAGPTPTTEDFTGTRRDNVISGTNRHRSGPRKSDQWWTGTAAHCFMDVNDEATTEQEWTFLLGGQGRMRFSGSGTTTRHYSAGCPYKPGGSETDHFTSSDEGKVITFSWRIR